MASGTNRNMLNIPEDMTAEEWIRSIAEMGLSPLADWEIAELCESENPLIEPFVEGKKRTLEDGTPVPSYGCSETGYDVRLGNEFSSPKRGVVLDPMDTAEEAVQKWNTNTIDTPFNMTENSVLLVKTVERFNIPPNMVALVAAKSTMSRNAITPPLAVFEPGWSGTPTLALSNNSSNKVRMYPGGGFAQVLFFRTQTVNEDYGDGKYQNQGDNITHGTQ